MKKILLVGLCLMLVIPVMNVTAALNNPPSTPTIEGPESGETGTSYDYEICVSDPDGDDITLCIDWDDGEGEVCIGPYPSDSCVPLSHTWSSDGDYTIRVKAQDTSQAESEYAELPVSMPKAKMFNFYFQLFLDAILVKIDMIRDLIF